MTHPVTFSALDASALVVALQSYAIGQEHKGFYATARSYYEMAAKAALACGWDQQALVLKNNASFCGTAAPRRVEA